VIAGRDILFRFIREKKYLVKKNAGRGFSFIGKGMLKLPGFMKGFFS
jgi:hypothetical protein